MLTKYRVKWEIDVWAEDAVAAAEEAQRIQRDPNSSAVVFDVIDENGELHRLDLWEE